ncbi:MAG: NTP transferase domain-containing protein [Deltaproteobacteria bacterium]|nr:NTP transferase domain-containing protein [Deltaproteobacteria bacterium]
MHVVVMAGGSGTRFWPVSRQARPKQFLNITGGQPMVVETCDRVTSLVSDEEIILIVGREHLNETKTLFKGRDVHILAEPVGRSTAACIGLGAVYAAHLGCQRPVVFMPADHFIAKPAAFVESLKQASEIASSEAIVTLGIVPTRPETGYGYIQWKEERPDFWKQKAYRVVAFVEKPTTDKAKQYMLRGDYLWNAGIFVATPKTILKALERYLPPVHQGMMRLVSAFGAGGFENQLEVVYEKLESISFDYGVMEKIEDAVFVVPCDCGWSDVGSWESLFELREAEQDENGNFREGECMLIDCKKSFVSSRGGKMISCLGLKNCLVVDTQDALLVADMKKSQEIRRITEQLKLKRRNDLF